MEYKILSESLVYYAVRNSKTGEYRAIAPHWATTPTLNAHTKLFISSKNAKDGGRGANCDEVVKVKLVVIE